MLGARAAAKANAAIDPVELPPDRYEVVLEPSAVADLLENLSYYGFNAKAVAEQRSFVRVGDAQFDSLLMLADDAPAAGVPWDADGTPTRRVPLVDAGTSVGLTHDRRTAAAAGATSTGNGVGSVSFGALARHLVLAGAGGDDATEVDWSDRRLGDRSPRRRRRSAGCSSATSGTRGRSTRGRCRSPASRATACGSSRTARSPRALRNFRFTQSYAQALMPGAVLGVGAVATALPGDTYSATMPWWTAPALRLASWNFTGGASG